MVTIWGRETGILDWIVGESLSFEEPLRQSIEPLGPNLTFLIGKTIQIIMTRSRFGHVAALLNNDSNVCT